LSGTSSQFIDDENEAYMDWIHIVAVVILVVAGVMIYLNKRKGE
jgi:hypothetical protein